MAAIKQALPLDGGRGSRGGGFLLGCSRERYAALIETADVLLVERDGQVGGFAVVLPDAALRTSDFWERRDLIRWRVGKAEPPENEPSSYFDQLALRRGWPRLHGLLLALGAARRMAAEGHVHLYATILDQPVRNEAAIPLLGALGAAAVGSVGEHYEGVGAVVSELHHARLQDGLAALASTATFARILPALLRAGG
jgi:hypothetical protein